MDRTRNIAQIIERQKIGYSLTNQYDIAYNKLKCLSDDLQFFHDSNGDRAFCPVFVSKFSHIQGRAHLLISANEDGKILLMNTEASIDTRIISNFQAHDNAIFDLAWTNEDMHFISASGDHTSTLWQIAEGDVKPVAQYQGHLHSVKTISCQPDDKNVFATGGRDGSLLVWDKRVDACTLNIVPDKVIRHSHEAPSFFKARKHSSQANSITGLAFQDENNLISCSAGDGLIKVWDMRKTYLTGRKKAPTPKYVLHYAGGGRNGFSNITISPCRLRLYANCIDNYVYSYDIGTYSDKPITRYSGPIISSFYIKSSVSPDGRYIASGSNDGKTYIWSVNRGPSPLVTLNGHAAEVTGVDWCKYGHLKMVSCSDDATLRIWQLHRDKYVANDPRLHGWAEQSESLETSKVLPIKKRKLSSILKPCGQTQNSAQKENTCPDELHAEKKHCTESSIDKSTIIGDLPNLVVDGVSPHIHQCSPRPKNKNWLSLLKPKTVDVNDQSPNSKSQSLAKSPQLANKKKLTGNNLTYARGSLLKFFKVSSRSSICDQQGVTSPETKNTVPTIQA